MMQFFYSNNIIIDRNSKKMIILDKVESNHCMNVLRYNIGDNISIVDGKGTLFKGEIYKYSKKECQVKVLEEKSNYKKCKYNVHIAIAPTKNHERLEWFVEKAIEIGVNEISFIKCERSLRKQVRMNRINKVAKTAMKQTLKAFLPIINSLENFDSFINNNKHKNGFICYLENGNKQTLMDYKSIIKNGNTYILIGPEGDFNEKEIQLALSSNLKPVSLGESRLRTETAGIVSCHIMNILNA